MALLIGLLTGVMYALVLPGRQRNSPWVRSLFACGGALAASAVLALIDVNLWIVVAGQVLGAILGISVYHRVLLPWLVRHGHSWE